MGNPINDGGPAFPRPFGDNENGYVAYEQDGMSLRDWLAGTMSDPFSATAEPEAASAITGVPLPEEPYSERKVWFKFWAEAEAAARYMKADAMLKAREVKP